MKTAPYLLLLALAAPASADEPASVLELLRSPGPALSAVLAPHGANRDQPDGLRPLDRMEPELRNTRSISPSQALGGNLVAAPGRRVTLR